MNPRIVIAGTQSGVGKTTLSIGLMAALDRLGYNVQPYKVGPDYIDPGFHTLVTGNSSRNLDSFFLGAEGVKESFLNSAKEADISVIEGVMGLFDGKKGTTDQGSTAHVAKILKSPVILVMDVKKMARSAAALAYGYTNFDSQLNVAGIILNSVGSKGHYQMVKRAVEQEVGIEVVGYLPRQKDLNLPERHLGLVPTTESKELTGFIDRLIDLVKEYIDLDQLISLAQDTTELTMQEENIFNNSKEYNVTLGVAYDQAFNFYYQDNLDLLKSLGAKLKYFSPIQDSQLPKVDGLYLGGGFPESFLPQLAENEMLKESIYQQVKAGLPIYAECGGLMYLTEEIKGFEKDSFSMVGLIPGKVEMTDRLQAMGYVTAKAQRDNLLLEEGEEVKGHEFHHSKLVDLDNEIQSSYQLFGGKGVNGRFEGVVINNLLASYVHLHFGSNPKLAYNLLKKCQNYKDQD